MGWNAGGWCSQGWGAAGVSSPLTAPTWYEATFGATADLISTMPLTTSENDQKAMIAFSADLSACANGTFLFGWNNASTPEISIRIISATPALRLFYGDGTNTVNVDLSGFNYTTPGEFIFIATLDTAQATAAAGLLAVAGTTSLTQSVTSWQAASVALGGLNDLEIGERAGSGHFAGKMKWFWFDAGNHAGTYPDPTLVATQNKFAQGTLLSDGSNVCGGKPLVFFGGSTLSSWTSGTNHGAGGSGTWTVEGTIT